MDRMGPVLRRRAEGVVGEHARGLHRVAEAIQFLRGHAQLRHAKSTGSACRHRSVADNRRVGHAAPRGHGGVARAKIGLDAGLVETWVRRVPYGARTIDENIVTTQQGVADMFYRAKLIPKAVTVKDNVWRDQDA